MLEERNFDLEVEIQSLRTQMKNNQVTVSVKTNPNFESVCEDQIFTPTPSSGNFNYEEINIEEIDTPEVVLESAPNDRLLQTFRENYESFI